MSCCGTGKLVTFELSDARLITLDLDCDEDWGDIKTSITRDDDGNIIPGSETIDIGHDDYGYAKVVRCFEELERDEDDFISGKWQTFGEVDKLDVIEWVLVRMLCFCEGYGMEDLKSDLEEYGIDIDSVTIPEEWK